MEFISESIIRKEALFMWSSGFGPMSMLTIKLMYNSLVCPVQSILTFQDKVLAALMHMKDKKRV